MRGDKGITLVELVIAVLILSIGTIAAMRAVDQAQRVVGGEELRAVALTVAQNRAEDLRLAHLTGTTTLPGSVEMGHVTWTVETHARSGPAGLASFEIIVTAPDAPGAVLETQFPRVVQ
ncbi:MAG: type II secretion system protein [Brevirhabdus sp.]